MASERAYVLASTAWPRSVWGHQGYVKDDLMVTIREDGKTADFGFEWHDLGGAGWSPVLRMFDDSWWAIDIIAPILRELDDERPSPQELIDQLNECGFRPSEHHGQLERQQRPPNPDRMEFERLRREHPDWFGRPRRASAEPAAASAEREEEG